MCLIPTMLCAGLLGGTAYCLFYKTKAGSQNPELNSTEFLSTEWWLQWLIAIAMGITAAFAVPVFLDATSSNLIANIVTASPRTSDDEVLDPGDETPPNSLTTAKPDREADPSDWYVFFGFCVIAAFASQRFMPAMVDRMLRDMQAQVEQQGQQLAQQTQQLHQQGQMLQETAQDTADLTQALSEPTTVVLPATQTEAGTRGMAHVAPVNWQGLTSDEQQVLTQLERGRREKQWLHRSPAGLAQDANLPIEQVEAALTTLIEKGLVVRREGGGIRGYRITDVGRLVLANQQTTT